MALLDTTALIDLSRSKRSKHFAPLIALIRGLISQGQTIYTSRINEAEFRVGEFLVLNQASENRRIEVVLESVVVLEFDRQAALRYAEIQAHLTRSGQRCGTADTFIAAIALANGQPIVTRNPKDFTKVPRLNVLGY